MLAKRSMSARVLALALMLCLTAAAPAGIIYVDDSAPPPPAGANNGSSWEDAFLDLQDALAIAKAGDEIRIAQGTYKPAPSGGPREATFNLVSGAVIQGGYAGFSANDPDKLDPDSSPTFLSGSLGSKGAAFHVVTGVNLAKGTAIRGLRIGGGSADADEPPHDAGGGMRLTDSVIQVLDCHISANFAFHGGAGVALNSELTIEECRIVGNSAFQSGAGIWTQGGMLSIANSVFVENHCSAIGGAGAGLAATHCHVRDSYFENNLFQFGHGGGAWVGPGSRLERCVFINNEAHRGGGLWMQGAIALDCLFLNNNSNEYGGAMSSGGADQAVNCRFIGNISDLCGGSVYNPEGSLTMVNCAFSGNESYHQGGAIRSDDNLTLINCSIVGNRISEFGFASAGGGVYANGQFIALNTIFWDNLAPKGSDAEAHQLELGPNAKATLTNCCLMGWTGSLDGVGNHGNDPNFVDADGPDNIYGTADDSPRLSANSPCIDTGDSALLPPDAFDLDEDGDTDEPLPIDLDGLPRVVGANVDMGAFEFQGAPCRADIDGSNAVDVDDLITVILGWGACTLGEPCPADLDLNMQVDVDDLIEVLLPWGRCP
jgi:predicted outer membrane repeat protein